MSVNVVVEFRVKESCTEDFSNLAKTVKQDLPTVEGCMGVVVHRRIDKQQCYLFIEQWQTQCAHETHIRSLRESGVWQHVLGLLESEPKTNYYTIL